MKNTFDRTSNKPQSDRNERQPAISKINDRVVYGFLCIALILCFIAIWPISVSISLFMVCALIGLNSVIGLLYLITTLLLHGALLWLYPDAGAESYGKDVSALFVAYVGPIAILATFFIALDFTEHQAAESYRLRYSGFIYRVFSFLSTFLPLLILSLIVQINITEYAPLKGIGEKYRGIDVLSVINIKSVWGKLTGASLIAGQILLLWARIEAIKKIRLY